MRTDGLYSKYIVLLVGVNDENQTNAEHGRRYSYLNGWLDALREMNIFFNGDYHYLELFDKGEMEERPLCCGQFIDWKSNV